MRRSPWILLLTMIAAVALVLAACGNGDGGNFATDAVSRDQAVTQGSAGAPSVAPQPAFEEQAQQAEAAVDSAADFDFGDDFAEEPPSLPTTGGPTDGGGATPAVQTAGRQVIQTASLTVQVEDVDAAADSVRETAEAVGGFVEQLQVSSQEQGGDGFVVIRVPVDQFFDAMERLRLLGEVLFQNVGAQDVTEQLVDLDARLRSLQAEEVRLIDLLEQADTVSEILVVESELSRIRLNIERLAAQQASLERRVALSTITVSLVPPRAFFTEPPSASFGIEVGNVERRMEEVKDLAERLGGVVDRASLRVIDDEESANVSIRVPRDGFDEAVSAIEQLGDVRSKQIEEGGAPRFELPEGAVIEEPDEPDASISVALAEGEDSSDTALIASLAGSLGGVALLVVIGLAIWLLRRGARPSTAA